MENKNQNETNEKSDDLLIKDLDNISEDELIESTEKKDSSIFTEEEIRSIAGFRNEDGKIKIDYVEDTGKTSENNNKNNNPGKGKILGKYNLGIKSMLGYFLAFFIVIGFCEVILRCQIAGGINRQNIFFMMFLPAEAMVLTAFSGFFKKNLINKIVFIIELAAVGFYYTSQVVYYKNFGSLWSVNMAGMGTDAMGNFGWAVTDALKASIGMIFIIFIPAILFIVFIFAKKDSCNKYNIAMHAVALVLTALLWVLGVTGLKIDGTDRHSAYFAYHNSLADTDTTSGRIGAMTTTVLESGSYFLGIKTSNSNEALSSVDVASLTMTPEPVTENQEVNTPDKTVAADVSANEVSDNDVLVAEAEEVVETVKYKYDEIDFDKLETLATDDDIKALCQYFKSKPVTESNEMTGFFKDYNLIYICAESFWSYACDEQVTPTLYKMAHNGIVLDNYYNSFKNTTTNGEYSFSTSLWPDVSRDASCGTAVGSFAQSVSKFMPFGMGKMFADAGYKTYGFHNYYGHYYRRSYSWPNLGYENLKFMGDGMRFSTNWPASDYELMEQSVDDYINEDKFITYYMTFSGHGPYTSANVMYNKNVRAVKELLGDREYTDNAIGYLAGELELDKAMEYLLDRLEKAGKADNTVIVIAGDHYPYYLTDQGRDSLVGYTPDENFEIYHSNCIIYNAGMDKPINTDTYCCNVDIMPTMYNLFDIPFDSRLLCGTDVFSDGPHKATLYNQSFITDMVKYNAETGEEEWLCDTSAYRDRDLANYLDAQIQYTEGTYAAATKLLAKNFYLFVWENSGLMTEDELTAENKRENGASQRANSELSHEKSQNTQLTWTEAAAQLGGTVDPNTGNIVNPTTGEVMVYAPQQQTNTTQQPAVDPNAGAEVQPQPQPEQQVQPEAQPEPQPEAQPEPQPEAQPEPQPEAQPEG